VRERDYMMILTSQEIDKCSPKMCLLARRSDKVKFKCGTDILFNLVLLLTVKR